MKTFKPKSRNSRNTDFFQMPIRPRRPGTEQGSPAMGRTPLQAMIEDSPVVRAEAARIARINNSPAQVAQRKLLAPYLDPPVQRQKGLEEEELLQGKAAPDTLQRLSLDDDEEMLQGRFDPVQRQGDMEEDDLLQGRFAGTDPAQRLQDDGDPEGNRTGMPDQLKAGMERLSGFDLSDVRVHYNSARPAQVNALAFTQGQDIHVAPGQERHLPHEAWHSVQQAEGRVKPTLQLKGGVPVNDDQGLEHEADVMGARAMEMGLGPASQPQTEAMTSAGDQSPDIDAAQARRLLPRQSHAPLDHPIQRTAWEKTADGWRRRPYGEGVYEKDTASETTPPPAQIGKVGWHYSSTANAYYDSYEKYKKAVRPYTEAEIGDKENFKRKYEVPPDPVEPRMMTTDLKAEDRLLKGTGGGIDFAEDLTRNYLLWSVPKYTGENIVKETKGTLESVSGEAAAEEGVHKKQGYMMKQTQEHMEALTAISMLQGDENIQQKDIQAQYGSTDPTTFDTTKVDPLHNPRDPESQSSFIAILKLIDSYYENPDDQAKTLREIGTTISTKTSLIFKLVFEDMIHKHKSKKDFNKDFFNSGLAERLAKTIAEKNEPFGPRDEQEEVTRAVLKDKSDPNLNLVGGRQAVFDTIWGPKSATVVEKAATRYDAVKSHGLTYHWNPKTTVQANHEFPPYLDLVQKLLGPKMGLPEYQKVKPAYENVVKALNEIIQAVKAIQPQGKAQVTELPKIREKQIQIILDANRVVEDGMAFIRDNLPK